MALTPLSSLRSFVTLMLIWCDRSSSPRQDFHANYQSLSMFLNSVVDPLDLSFLPILKKAKVTL